MKKSLTSVSSSKLERIIKTLDKHLTDLGKLLRDGNEIEEWQLTLHFEYMKKFVEEIAIARQMGPMNARELKTNFLTYTIKFFEVIPKVYKKKIYDKNSCSMIFDFIELTSLRLEDNKIFIQNPYFNNDRLDAFLRESIKLMQQYFDMITVTEGLKLSIKTLKEIKEMPLKLNRASDYFQMFSFCKDKKYLMNTIRLLISATERVYPDNRKYQYLFLSIVAKIGENFSPRTISERMIKFLSANIDLIKIVELRNFIYHREQDLDNHLEAVIRELSISDFDKIKEELLKLKRAVHMGLRIIYSLSSIEEIYDFYSSNWTLISLKLYDDYYEKGINHLCPKLTLFSEIDNLEQDFKEKLEAIKDSMRHMSHTQDKESFEAVLNLMIGQIMDYCKRPGIGKFLKESKNIKSKDIVQELLAFREPKLVDLTNLQRFITIKPTSKEKNSQKALALLKAYLVDLKDIIQNLNSKLTAVNGLELYEDENFSNYVFYPYMVDSQALAIPQEFFTEKIFELSEQARELERILEISRQDIVHPMDSSINGTTRYYKLQKNHSDVHSKQKSLDLKHIYISLSFKEASELEGRPILKYDSDMGLYNDFSSLTYTKTFKELLLNIGVDNLEKRLKHFVAHLDMSYSIEFDDDLEHHYIGTIFSFVVCLVTEYYKKDDSKYVLHDINIMRNLFCHNRDIIPLSVSYGVMAVRYLIRFTKFIENAVISNLEFQLLSNSSSLIKQSLVDTSVLTMQKNLTSNTVKKSTISEFSALDPQLLKTQEASRQEAEKKGAIGPREIKEFILKDVDDLGNCFYLAVADQMQAIGHYHIRSVPEGTDVDSSLRLAVQRENFRDREWAEDSTFDCFVTEFPDVILAIIDTRYPERGFTCYYIDVDGTVTTNNGGMALELPDRPIIRIAATGNHFLSVKNHPSLEVGAITDEYNTGIQQEYLELSTGSGEQKEDDIVGSSPNPNDVVVRNVETLYNNRLLNHKTFLDQAYRLAGIKAVNLLLELGADQELAEQILHSTNEFGSEKILKTLLGIDKSTKLQPHGDYTLEAIKKIEDIIGKQVLVEITGFYQYVSALLSNKPFSVATNKVIQIMGNLVKNLEEWLDFGIAYEDIDINNQASIIVAQLEGMFDFVASGIIHVVFPPKYPDFDPDDYYGGGSSGGSNGGGDGYSEGRTSINNIDFSSLFAGHNSTTNNTLDYSM